MNGRRAKERRRASAYVSRVGQPGHVVELPPGMPLPTWDGDESTDINCAEMVGWCATEADIVNARKATHDALIAAVGDRRNGPVAWREATGADALALLNEIAVDPPSEEHGNYYRQLRGKLREFGGYIVVALAPATEG